MINVSIRKALDTDLSILYSIAKDMGFVHEHEYFEKCLEEQRLEKRVILLAEYEGQYIGYAQLIWSPHYHTFKRLGIPEIQDLNIIPSMRRRGLATALVEAAETLSKEEGKTEIGIAVGLYARYGPAQQLYIKAGYNPDGAGVCYDDIPVQLGEMRPVDDLLTLKFIKTL